MMWLSREWREFIAQQHGFDISDLKPRPVETQQRKQDDIVPALEGNDQGETQRDHFMKYCAEIHFAIQSGWFRSPDEVHSTVDEFFQLTKYPRRWSVEHIEDNWICCTFRTSKLERIKKVHVRLQDLEEDARFDYWSIFREHNDGSRDFVAIGSG